MGSVSADLAYVASSASLVDSEVGRVWYRRADRRASIAIRSWADSRYVHGWCSERFNCRVRVSIGDAFVHGVIEAVSGSVAWRDSDRWGLSVEFSDAETSGSMLGAEGTVDFEDAEAR